MRILLLSKYDMKGGASRAALSSLGGLRKLGADAQMLVGIKSSNFDYIHEPPPMRKLLVLASFAAEKLPSMISRDKKSVRSLHMFGLTAKWIERRFNPDIVLAHKIDGLIPFRELGRFSVPVIWRLHDMWPICGTQHYAPDSEVLDAKYCEVPKGSLNEPIEEYVRRRKRAIHIRTKNVIFCTPSNWLSDCVGMSSFVSPSTQTVTIPNGIDTDVFKPQKQSDGRHLLNIPTAKKVVLFGADAGTRDRRKGFDLLLSALELIPADLAKNMLLLIFGDSLPEEVKRMGVESRSVGKISDNAQLATIYSTADLFIAPSRQENLSLTVLESLSCGTPVVAFNIGGMPDMITNSYNGWLAESCDPVDLGKAIRTGLTVSTEESCQVRRNARETVVNGFSLKVEATGMLKLIDRTLVSTHAIVSS